MEDKITDHFGDLKLIDLMWANKEKDEARLALITSGYIDGTPEMQTALLDKMQGYLTHIQSDVFKTDYPQKNVVIELKFQEKPSELIIQLLYGCYEWCKEWGAQLEVFIDNRFIEITRDEKGDYYIYLAPIKS